MLNSATQIEIVRNSTDPVRQRAEDDGAEHHAEQSGTRHEARAAGADAHVLHDRRQGRANDREVVAVEDQDQQTPEKNEPVKAVEPGLVG